ncbi:heavy metal translocating P-type ATPase [Longibacter sp.]|jgi:heavy metal translocating P-type ATPase|uniref:heavy metal translocating P-type ATPase n=1 Tax=Longibacter sp. TaxID=2045415 RepID=UPI003EBF88AF
MSDYCDHCGLPVGEHPVSSDASAGSYCCYGCRMLDEAEASGHMLEDERQQALLVRVFAGLLMAAFVMVLSLAISSEYGLGAFRTLHHEVGTAHWVLLLVAIPALLLLGLPVARSALADLRRGRLSLHVLFALGTGSAVAASAFSYIRGTGPVYIETAVMLLAIYTLGRYLTARAKGRTTTVLRHLLDVPDATYRRLHPSAGPVGPGSIEPGDHIRVATGDVIPIDGVVEDGRAYVDESSLTGEARPAVRAPGASVYAGTATVDGALVVRAVAVGEERRLARVEQMMRRALERPPRIQQITDRIMRVLIPGVVILALATFAGWYVAAGFEKALYTALSVVLITCPCALGIAIPLTLVVGLGEGARDGVLVRDGETLMDLARVDTVVFDKTGTLTTVDSPSVEVYAECAAPVTGTRASAMTAMDGSPSKARAAWSEDAILALASGLEETSHHPIGRAIRERATDLQAATIHDAETIPGGGIVGRWRHESGDALPVGIGNERVVERLAARVPPTVKERWTEALSDGRTPMMLVVGNRVVGVIIVTERLRDGASQTLDRLRHRGLHIGVLTGDREAAGRRLEASLETEVQAGVTPENKARYVRHLQDDGAVVAMLGDGINDAAAIAEADVGIARTDGAGVSIDAADIALYHPDLPVFADLVDLSHRTRGIVHQNLGWTFGYNAVGLGLAVAGLLHPIAAVVIMAGSSALVTWNAFRLKTA